MTINKLL